MTEREKREKAIDEIEKIMIGICKEVKFCPNNTCDKCKAISVYNAGYRKEEEVRKKTAKEILQKWYQENKATNFEQDYVLELACDYGVEVEE